MSSLHRDCCRRKDGSEKGPEGSERIDGLLGAAMGKAKCYATAARKGSQQSRDKFYANCAKCKGKRPRMDCGMSKAGFCIVHTK